LVAFGVAGTGWAQGVPDPLAGDTCQDAIVVAESGVRQGTTVGLQSQFSQRMDCSGWAWTGPDVIFRVDLEAGQRLEARDTQRFGWDSGIYILTDCDAANANASCLAGCDGACTASIEVQEATTVYVVLDGYNNAGGEYEVVFDIQEGPGPFEVVTVPWVGTVPEVPHDAVAGEWHYLQATAINCEGPIDYRWDFEGDGTWDTEWAVAPSRWNLGLKHTYPLLDATQLYIARVQGRCGEQTDTAQFPVRARVAPTKAQRVNRLISNGLWYGHITAGRTPATRQMHWRAEVDTAVFGQALLNRGHRMDLSPSVDPYAEDIRWMTHYIVYRPARHALTVQRGGVNPDVNGNGFGLRFRGEENYSGGPQLEFLASTGMPDYVVPADIGANDLVRGRTLREVVQDGAEYFYWSQTDIVWGEDIAGGWDYGASSGTIDSSQVGWAAVGLFAAEINMGIQTPQWVKDRVFNGVRYSDAARGGNADRYGGYGYRGWNSCGANHSRSGAMLNALGFALNRDPNNERAQATVDYIGNNFNNVTPDCWGGANIGNYYAMYQITKGMRSFVPFFEDAAGVDWYDQYVDFLLGSATADGRFQNDNRWMRTREIVHGLAMLILIPSVFESPPVAVANATPRSVGPGDVIRFSHNNSYNPDPTVPITVYRWNFIDYPVGLDLNDDGDFDDEGEYAPEDLDGDGVVSNDELVWEIITQDPNQVPTYTYAPDLAFGEERVYRVVLQVEDVLGRTGLDDESVVIRVAIINHPPVALPHPSGDPDAIYDVVAGRTYTLDGSHSFDPDSDDPPNGDFPVDSITYYGWDLDLDGAYEAETPQVAFAVPADWQIGEIRTAQFLVCDDGRWVGQSDEACEGDCSLCTRQTARLRVVPNTAPHAVVDQVPALGEGGQVIIHAVPPPEGAAAVTYEWICPPELTFEIIDGGAAIQVDAATIDGTEEGTEIGCRLTVRDDLGDSNSTPFVVTVDNRPPVIDSAQVEPAVEEGDAVLIVVEASDPNADDEAGLLYSVDCDGDGVLDILDSPEPVLHCHYADDGVYMPVVLVTDDDGGMDIIEIGPVQVSNVGPSISPVLCPPSVEGTPVVVQIVVRDPGDDLITCAIEAPQPVNSSIDAEGCVVSWTPTFEQAVAGEVTFTVAVTDDDGARDEVAFVCRPQWRDEDDDGLPDSWEEDHGLDPTLDDCHLDADGDGLDNCAEFDAGTDPTVPWNVLPPILLAPIEGAVVADETPDLLLENVDNPLNRPITYQYRVFVDAELDHQIAESDWIIQGGPLNSFWTVSENAALQQNHRYWWTARADDGVRPSDWAPAEAFVVDDGPEPPTAPVIILPEDGDQIADTQPDVVLINSTDPDENDELIYGCQIAKDADFEPLSTVASGPEDPAGQTALTLEDPVETGAWYFARCRATDSFGLQSPWSNVVRFSVGVVNGPPGPPTIIEPEHDLVTDKIHWVLVAGNAVDPDDDALTYRFWLSTDPGFDEGQTWVSGEIAEGPDGSTAWAAPEPLEDHTTYFWRVRARDQMVAGPAVTARFRVDLGNEPPSTPVPISPAANSTVPATPTFDWQASVDPDDDPITYEIELFTGSDEDPLWRRFLGGTSLDYTGELRDGAYEWRVRAADDQGNESAWSPRVPFQVHTPGLDAGIDDGQDPIDGVDGGSSFDGPLTGSGIRCNASADESAPGLLLLGLLAVVLRRRRR
jgi:uncharacterized protein (TIGR03382 family)